jgi:hypothetical protein
MTVHEDYMSQYAENSEMHKNKAEDLERNLPLLRVKSQKSWLR